MKIAKVNICNLNSLKGKQTTIDFTESPFSEVGLFAITGETGAGKTTILDAITLALYARVPRNCDPKDLMTHHTSESWAEVEFCVQEKKYRVKWMLNRARKSPTGKIQQVRRELADISQDTQGVILATKNREVDQMVKDIIGLDYHRFLRSVMLAQGEFAAFLKATKNERGELLERITGTDEYSKYSKFAYDKAKDEVLKLEQLKIKISEQTLLTNEQQTEYQNDLETYTTQAHHLEKRRNQLVRFVKSYEHIEQLQIQLQNIENQNNKLTQVKHEFKPKLEKLNTHKRALPFVAQYQKLLNDQEKYKRLNIENQSIKEQIEQLSAQKNQQEKALEIKVRHEEKCALEQQQSVTLIHEVISMDEKLNHKKEQLEITQKKQNELSQEIQKKQATYEDKKQQLEATKSQFLRLEEWLSKNAIDQTLEHKLPVAGNLLEQARKSKQARNQAKEKELNLKSKQSKLTQHKIELENQQKEIINQFKNLENQRNLAQKDYEKQSNAKRLAQIQEVNQTMIQDVQILRQLLEYSTFYEKNVTQLDVLNERFDAEKKAQEETDNLLEIQHEKCREAEAILHDKYQIYLRGVQIAKYEEDRKKLEKNQPCPLCGSENHPFIEKYEFDLGKDEQNWQTQKQEQKQLEQQLVEMEKQQQKHQTNIEHLKQQIRDIEHEKTEVEKRFNVEVKRMTDSFKIVEKYKINDAFHILKKRLEEHQNRLNQLTLLDEKINQLKTDQTKVADEKNSMEIEWQKVNMELQNITKEIQNAVQEYDIKNTDCLNFKSKIENLFDDFSELKHEKDWGVFFEELSKRQHHYKTQMSEFERLKESVVLVENEVQNLALKVEDYQKELEQIHLEWKSNHHDFVQIQTLRHEKFGTKNPHSEQKRLVHALEESKKNRSEVEIVLQNLRIELEKKQTLFTRLEDEKEHLEQKIQQEKKVFLENIKNVKFVQFEYFESAILTNETAKKWQNEWDHLQSEFTKLEQSMTDTRIRIQHEETQIPKQNTREEINLEYLKNGDSLKIRQQKIGEIKQVLKQNSETQTRFESIAKAIHEQEKITQKWMDLSDVIGSAQGDKFRIFAQGLTLVKLIGLANHHLEKLNPRYLIRQSKMQALELEILDTYQADNIRSMNTLSGGESFLVSLALALGLSDLAARKSKIESLFIDEGFGTLDHQTLDMAIATLESLQMTGKIIGVISHVQTLKERISTQIQVQKKTLGVSQIKIVG